MASINGTEDDDTLTGTANGDLINGFAGNDVISGNGGADTIIGGMGDDFIDVSFGAASVSGGAGNDRFHLSGISSGFPDTVFDGGAGVDTFDASSVSAGPNFLFFRDSEETAGSFTVADNIVSGVETVIGGSGPNWFLLQYAIAAVTLHGSDASDVFRTSFDHADVMFGYGGNDDMSLRPGDRAYGGSGDDRFDFWISGTGYADGEQGIDTLDLGFGWEIDLAAGTAESPIDAEVYTFSNVENVIVYAWMGYDSSAFGDEGNNLFSVNPLFNDGSAGVLFDGRGGNDTLSGSMAGDTLDGGGGLDWADYAGSTSKVVVDLLSSGNNEGDARGDTYTSIENLRGSDFGDALRGDNFANRIDGLTKADALSGRDGRDTLAGGAGGDKLTGGEGNDRFELASLDADDADKILDFGSGADRIALDGDAFGLNRVKPSQFVVGSAAGDANDRLIYDSATGKLFFDADGTGAAAQVLIARLSDSPALSAGDFVVI
ncbi:MAG: hypothetical protein H7X93_14865 [Sphingomonadaceae bacterium]|nr:hypothetical protein [Sphingomonadaceae bacterium]